MKTLSSQSIEAIQATMDASLTRSVQRLQSQMVWLTIAISGGPFLGLLGTVVGVMITFAAIAASGEVNVNAIAPGTAAALVATVAGLGVAIPCLFGYNYPQHAHQGNQRGHARIRGTSSSRVSPRRTPRKAQRPCQPPPKRRDVYDEINITPMLDLAYVLLLIFIIMTTATVQGIKVNLPKASSQPSLAQSKTKAITIAADGTIYLDTFAVTMVELENLLRQYKAATPDLPVIIKADSNIQYQRVVDVLDLMGKLEITQLGLVTQRIVK